MYYSTAQVAAMFEVSAQTIRRWTEEFRPHLLPGATPEQGRTRMFADKDMQVFALVAVLKAEGKQYEDIHAALGAGERGSVQQLLTTVNTPHIEIIKEQISLLKQELDEERAKRIEVQTERDIARGKEIILRERIQELEKEVAQLRADKK